MFYNDIDQNHSKVPEVFVDVKANYSTQVGVYDVLKRDSK